MRDSQKTHVSSDQAVGASVNADFSKVEFDRLFRDKGYNVTHSKAIQCSCKGKGSDHLSDCQNCGGTGWIFVNPTTTRMIMTSMQLDKNYDETARKDIGMVYVSARHEDKLGFMDKLQVIDGVATHHEVLFPVQDTTYYRSSTHYDIQEIEFIAEYVDSSTVLRKLVEGVDYTYGNNVIDFPLITSGTPNISIRYRHHPVFHVWDAPRENLTSLTVEGRFKRDPLALAVKTIAKRAHLILNAENWAGNRLLDNSWLPECDPVEATKLELIVRNSSAAYIIQTMSPSQRQTSIDILCGVFDYTFDLTFD